MLADCILTLIGYHFFDYSRYNPYTLWIFNNLHWVVWVLLKLAVIVVVWYLLDKLPKILKIITLVFICLIMLGAVLYDLDSIFRSHLYSAYISFFVPVLQLPIINNINSFLWGIYTWF